MRLTNVNALRCLNRDKIIPVVRKGHFGMSKVSGVRLPNYLVGPRLTASLVQRKDKKGALHSRRV